MLLSLPSAACILATSAGAFALGPPPPTDYGVGPRTFYLHRGSTYQQGCWGPCACALSAREPMIGTFTLRLITVGNATDFYELLTIDWRVPTLAGQPFNQRLTGVGNLGAGQSPFNPNQFMTLELSLDPAQPPSNVQQFQSDFGNRTAPPPIIAIELANSTTGCPGIRLQLVATWFRSDWNADAVISTQDLFDFLADYFAGRGDHNQNGATNVGDVFSFLADWFAGV